MTQCIVDVTVMVDNEKASDEAGHLLTSSDAAGCESKATCTHDLLTAADLGFYSKYQLVSCETLSARRTTLIEASTETDPVCEQAAIVKHPVEIRRVVDVDTDEKKTKEGENENDDDEEEDEEDGELKTTEKFTYTFKKVYKTNIRGGPGGGGAKRRNVASALPKLISYKPLSTLRSTKTTSTSTTSTSTTTTRTMASAAAAAASKATRRARSGHYTVTPMSDEDESEPPNGEKEETTPTVKVDVDNGKTGVEQLVSLLMMPTPLLINELTREPALLSPKRSNQWSLFKTKTTSSSDVKTPTTSSTLTKTTTELTKTIPTLVKNGQQSDSLASPSQAEDTYL